MSNSVIKGKIPWNCPHCAYSSGRHWNAQRHINKQHQGIGYAIKQRVIPRGSQNYFWGSVSNESNQSSFATKVTDMAFQRIQQHLADIMSKRYIAAMLNPHPQFRFDQDATWSTSIQYPKDRDDIFGFEAETCDHCMKPITIEYQYGRPGTPSYRRSYPHECDPHAVGLAKSFDSASDVLNRYIRRSLFADVGSNLLNWADKRQIVVTPYHIEDLSKGFVDIPHPAGDKRSFSLSFDNRSWKQINLEDQDNYYSWAKRTISSNGPTFLAKGELDSFLTTSVNSTFTLCEVISQGHAGRYLFVLAPSDDATVENPPSNVSGSDIIAPRQSRIRREGYPQ